MAKLCSVYERRWRKIGVWFGRNSRVPMLGAQMIVRWCRLPIPFIVAICISILTQSKSNTACNWLTSVGGFVVVGMDTMGEFSAK